ncbi:4Fe-4S dicluster domain-containing protein [Christensenellaceae bacterium OttesenSCG-928-M15]|nr:4Fe-4S dicluster domain-containing protein [Christensenellaceae bacterium OttesenSCG-928-M15]
MTQYLTSKATDCKHCYKCIRDCPVKAIRFHDNQAAIMQEECILCGTCYTTCPQNAKSILSGLEKAKALIKSGAPVYASIAPSFAANYPGVNIGAMRDALLKLGFMGVGETAIGATIVKQRYDEIVSEGKQSVVISTCCHTVNMLVQRHFPGALPYMAHVISPMQAHALSIRRESENAKVIFIGPCISKKAEAEEYPGYVDCVLMFTELDEWLLEQGIELSALPSQKENGNIGKARLFPIAGGVLNTMERANKDYHYIAVDGMEDCIAALTDIETGKLQNCFVEMSACGGSCISGPGMNRDMGALANIIQINSYAKEKDFLVAPVENKALLKQMHFNSISRPRFGKQAIDEVLAKTGKRKSEDELNCGSCGYETCREKAQAVLEGKAQVEMCLPYLMQKAQSFSDAIIKNTPNGVIVLDENLKIQQLNKAACQILHVRQQGDILKRHITCVMEPDLFLDVLEGARDVHENRVYLAEYDRYIRLTIIREQEYGVMIGIMRDITDSALQKEARRESAEKTIRVTDEVIDRQMRTVQEIASLLGETAAETKIALTKLKETLIDD